MRWLVLLVSAIRGDSFGLYGGSGKIKLSVGKIGDTLGGDGVYCSSTLGASGVLPPSWDPGCSGTLGAA